MDDFRNWINIRVKLFNGTVSSIDGALNTYSGILNDKNFAKSGDLVIVRAETFDTLKKIFYKAKNRSDTDYALLEEISIKKPENGATYVLVGLHCGNTENKGARVYLRRSQQVQGENYEIVKLNYYVFVNNSCLSKLWAIFNKNYFDEIYVKIPLQIYQDKVK
ncbi:MAG: hypothetical protein LBQ58_10995 [Synergistaceae bacterium]|jgi:hypothetical protein|nr:hypothetical protein [Synergistaceae bacterium]